MERKALDRIYDSSFSLDSICCTYSQDPDCAQSSDECQVIKLETCSNGVSSFIRISLPEGGYWSIDGEKDLMDLLKDFKTRFEFDNETN